jgi:hypothetical protein
VFFENKHQLGCALNEFVMDSVKLYEHVSSTKFQPKEIKSGHPADFSCALSPQSSQIFEPDLEKAIDCQGYEQMHKPGKCRGASSQSVEFANAARTSSGLSDSTATLYFSRTIDNELAALTPTSDTVSDSAPSGCTRKMTLLFFSVSHSRHLLYQQQFLV